MPFLPNFINAVIKHLKAFSTITEISEYWKCGRCSVIHSRISILIVKIKVIVFSPTCLRQSYNPYHCCLSQRQFMIITQLDRVSVIKMLSAMFFFFEVLGHVLADRVLTSSMQIHHIHQKHCKLFPNLSLEGWN